MGLAPPPLPLAPIMTAQAAFVAASVATLVQLSGLPWSTYRLLVQLSSATLVPYFVLQTLYWAALDDGQFATLVVLAYSAVLVNMGLFVLAELQFLKMMHPLMPGVPVRLVTAVQAAVCVLAVALHVAMLVPLGLDEQVVFRAFTAFLLAMGVADFGFQCALVRIGVTRLGRTPWSLRAGFAGLVAAALALLVVGFGWPVLAATGNKLHAFVVDMACGVYELVAIQIVAPSAMVQLEPARPDQTSAPAPAHDARGSPGMSTVAAGLAGVSAAALRPDGGGGGGSIESSAPGVLGVSSGEQLLLP
ncbi:hypothetical protein HK105_205445, partial [Polyrhizophydium stewartii]